MNQMVAEVIIIFQYINDYDVAFFTIKVYKLMYTTLVGT